MILEEIRYVWRIYRKALVVCVVLAFIIGVIAGSVGGTIQSIPAP